MGVERQDRGQPVESLFRAGTRILGEGVGQDRNGMSLVPPPLTGARFCGVTPYGKANGMVRETGVCLMAGLQLVRTAGFSPGVWVQN